MSRSGADRIGCERVSTISLEAIREVLPGLRFVAGRGLRREMSCSGAYRIGRERVSTISLEAIREVLPGLRFVAGRGSRREMSCSRAYKPIARESASTSRFRDVVQELLSTQQHLAVYERRRRIEP